LAATGVGPLIAARYGFARRMPPKRVPFKSGALNTTSAKLPDIDCAATARSDNIFEVVSLSQSPLGLPQLAVFYAEGQDAIHRQIVRPDDHGRSRGGIQSMTFLRDGSH
jgi:hypothetical protein